MLNINDFLPHKNEKPLDSFVSDGGLIKIFRTLAVIGDSLSSGEFESYNEQYGKAYHDFYEYSWGQYIAREAGINVYNFSRGGMTAKEYMESFSKYNGFWKEDKLCQGYIIALGVNDLFGQGIEIGKAEDSDDRNSTTFAAYYGSIIRGIKQIQPHARIFLMSMPREEDEAQNETKSLHAELLHDFAEKYDGVYVLDLFKYACVYDEEFKKTFYMGSHMNAAGYILTAKMVMSYIDYIIRNNMDDFIQVPFIDKPYYNENHKR